jgi:CheY-like chemotaxis protein
VPQQPLPPEEPRRRLLLVDDNDFCLDVTEMILSNFLEEQGYSFIDVETCSNNVLEHLLDNDDYDFVMMDLNFPGTPSEINMLPGLWCTQQFRLRRPWSPTRFVAFSGSTDEVTRASCREIGMMPPYIIGKPADDEQLRTLLDSVFKK